MRAEINRPTLAELWRVLSTILEGQEAEGAPEAARTLAIAALTGRTGEAHGVRVERRGEVFIFFVAAQAKAGDITELTRPDRTRRKTRPRRSALVAR